MATPVRTNSPTNSTTRNDKSKNKSKIIILSLSSDVLRKFPHEAIKTDSGSNSSAEAEDVDMPTVKVSEATTDNNSESNSTPAPGQENSQNGDLIKKRKGPAPGSKRNSGQISDGLLKPRGKPGPKKKPRLEDGTIDHGNKPVAGPTGGVSSHKLGPKANQGAINAGLRALDRSGAPCRKWMRNEFRVKSFTGIVWEVPSWKGGEKALNLNGDDLTDAKDSSLQSSSDIKPTRSDAAMDSNAGDQPFDTSMSQPNISSTPLPNSVIAAAG